MVKLKSQASGLLEYLFEKSVTITTD